MLLISPVHAAAAITSYVLYTKLVCIYIILYISIHIIGTFSHAAESYVLFSMVCGHS